MSVNSERTPAYKPKFILSVFSKNKLHEEIHDEIIKAIGERVNFHESHSFDNVSHTHRHVFEFSPASLEPCKRRILEMAVRHKDELIVFFDPAESFGIRNLLEQIQKMFDKIMGVILPTEATIIFLSPIKQNIETVHRSLEQIFFNGNNIIKNIQNLKQAEAWYKISFKVNEPIKFKSDYHLFKKQNRGLTVFYDLKRKELRSYAPYAGFIGILINIVQFRAEISDFMNQFITTCSQLIHI